jgi:hypothetical protein
MPERMLEIYRKESLHMNVVLSGSRTSFHNCNAGCLSHLRLSQIIAVELDRPNAVNHGFNAAGWNSVRGTVCRLGHWERRGFGEVRKRLFINGLGWCQLA